MYTHRPTEGAWGLVLQMSSGLFLSLPAQLERCTVARCDLHTCTLSLSLQCDYESFLLTSAVRAAVPACTPKETTETAN